MFRNVITCCLRITLNILESLLEKQTNKQSYIPVCYLIGFNSMVAQWYRIRLPM